jgi:5-methylcytosine-specific restriction endonuclease McrA
MAERKRPRLRCLKPALQMLPARVPILLTPGSWRAGKTTDERGYTYRWKQFRLSWLAEHPLCGDREGGRSGEHSACVRDGRVTAAEHVDHVVPHRGDMDAFWRGPYQSLCPRCHAVKTQQEEPNA